jgi:hypothetical protein
MAHEGLGFNPVITRRLERGETLAFADKDFNDNISHQQWANR